MANAPDLRGKTLQMYVPVKGITQTQYILLIHTVVMEKCYLIIGSWFSLDGRGRRGRRRGDSSLWLRPDEDQRRLISFASKSPQTPADTFTQRQTAEPQ